MKIADFDPIALMPRGKDGSVMTGVMHGKRPRYATWLRNGQGDHGLRLFAAHDLPAGQLRALALADMVLRSGEMLVATL